VDTVESLRAENERLRAQLRARSPAAEVFEARLSAFINAAPVVLWAIDPTGRITLSEGRALQTLGLVPGQLVGANVFELYVDMPHVTDPIHSAIAGKGGKPVLVDLGDSYWESHYFPVFEEGGVAWVVGLSQDVTARVVAERERRQLEGRWRQLMTHTPDTVLLVDPCYRVIYVNHATYHAIEDVVGSSVLSRVKPAHREELRQIIDDVFADPTGPRSIVAQITDDRWFLCRVFPVDDTGENTVVVVATEITEQRRADEERGRLESRLRHLQKVDSLGVLAGGIAHDFNNLLVGILGNADLALDEAGEGAVQHALSEILRAGERARDLCRQLLDYSGKGRFELENVDLSELVSEMESLISLSQKGGLSVHLELDDELPSVNADATQLRQVVMNLLTNAAEASAGGAVYLRTGCDHFDADALEASELRDAPPPGSYVFLEVEDDGQGMAPEVRERIFDPFFTTKQTGRGLGMASVLGILRGHHGALLLDTTVGRGTRIRVLLPVSSKPRSTTAAAGRPQVPRGVGVVLVADDEEGVRWVASRALQQLGFEVVEAVDGPAAIELFESRRTEIVLLLIDLSMPGISGKEALVQIRSRAPAVPAILTSGYSEEHLAGLDPDSTRFLAKPFRVHQLHEVVGELLEFTEQ